MDAIWDRTRSLTARLREGLAEMKGVTLQDIGREKCAITTFSLDGIDPLNAKTHLRRLKINVSVSSPSSTLLDATKRGLPPIIRSSAHYYNDENEIDLLLKELHNLIKLNS